MKIKIFWQENCPNCPKVKELGEELEKEFTVQYFDVNSVDGLAEASYHDIMSTPSVVIADNSDSEIKTWREKVPFLEEIKEETIKIED